tara:strand:+ start:636 stop:773 length:138 start_codon:yes stop_codon:yes gene_type:complete
MIQRPVREHHGVFEKPVRVYLGHQLRHKHSPDFDWFTTRIVVIET